MWRNALPPRDAQRGTGGARQRERGRESEGRHGPLKGRGGNVAVRRRGVSIIKEFCHGEHVETHRINYAAITERRVVPRAAAAGVGVVVPAASSALPRVGSAGTQGARRDGAEVHTDTQVTWRRDRALKCRVWVPGLTRSRWRRWLGNPARRWKCRTDTSPVWLQTPAATGASSLVRGVFREHF